MRISARRLVRGLGLLAGLAGVSHTWVAPAQQRVMAPGHQPLGAPLPRYVYNVVAADFATSHGHPLIKSRFNLYDPAGITTQQLEQSIPRMGELNIDTYRIELAWGRARQGLGTNTMVGGSVDALSYDFTPLDHILRMLQSQNVQLLGAYSYTPHPLQDPNLSPRYGDNNLMRKDTTPTKHIEKWKEVITAFVRHYREIGLPFGIHEVWNEPDGTYGFFSGAEAEYQELYKATVEAVRAVDPDAVVAGPAADHHLLWNETFPDFVARNKLPLDVYSFHEYGSGELVLRTIDKVNRSLNRHRYFDTTALSLDEWHDADCCTWCHDDVRHRYEGAAELLHDFTLLLARPELASVSWAWWLDPAGGINRGTGCMGLLTRDGRPKAVFNAWKLYAGMPVDRRQATVEGPLEAIASSDQHRAGLLIWNRGSYARRVDVRLKNLPFSKGKVRIYRIDASHASALDGSEAELAATETYSDLNGTSWSWLDGQLPRNATIYFEADDGTGDSELAPVSVGNVIRLNRYYPARGKTTSYSDFDRKTWIARLGMMDERIADETIGILADGLPQALDVTVHVEGKLEKVNADSLLGMRLDYRDAKSGKAVWIHGPYRGVDLFDKNNAAIPWGFKQAVDDMIAVKDLAGFQIPLRKYAPPGWTGKLHISFVMRNAGQGARAKFVLRPAKASS